VVSEVLFAHDICLKDVLPVSRGSRDHQEESPGHPLFEDVVYCGPSLCPAVPTSSFGAGLGTRFVAWLQAVQADKTTEVSAQAGFVLDLSIIYHQRVTVHSFESNQLEPDLAG
jgi:hypothetical protein